MAAQADKAMQIFEVCAANKIQVLYRIAKKAKIRRRKESAITCQRLFRGWYMRHNLLKYLAARVLQREWRTFAKKQNRYAARARKG